jgi:hypothetical protein
MKRPSKCLKCGRRFRKDRSPKHGPICKECLRKEQVTCSECGHNYKKNCSFEGDLNCQKCTSHVCAMDLCPKCENKYHAKVADEYGYVHLNNTPILISPTGYLYG